CRSDALDSGCDLRRIREVGPLGEPWSVGWPGPYNRTDHSASALPCVGPRACILDSTDGAFWGMGSRTICRAPQPHTARLGGAPLPDGLGLLPLVVLSPARDTPPPSRRGGALESGQQGTRERRGVPGAEAMEALPGGASERASQRGLCMLPWRPAGL